MPYYATLDEDLARAKEILQRGRVEPADLPMPEHVHFTGTIYGADIHAAYQLLHSFAEAIEAVGPKVCELAIRHERLRGGDPH